MKKTTTTVAGIVILMFVISLTVGIPSIRAQSIGTTDEVPETVRSYVDGSGITVDEITISGKPSLTTAKIASIPQGVMKS